MSTTTDYKLSSEIKIKIGIIGSGISGASNAYFLKQIFGDNVEIVVFEKTDLIGGRLATFDFNKRQYEYGGTVIHPSNKYMEEFVKILGLDKKDKDDKLKRYFGFFDSNGLIVHTTGKLYGLLDKIAFFKHFGFLQLINFNKLIRNFIKDFSKIYRFQDHGFVFKNLEEFLTKVNPKLYKISQTSLENSLREKKFNDRIIHQLASIACLTNYGQSVEIDGFVGSVSLAGMIDELWSIKNGNKLVPEKLIESSKAELKLNTKVKLIAKDPLHADKNMIIYQTEDQTEVLDNSFDYVIIAFPIYQKFNDEFKLEFDTKQEFSSLEMQKTNTYFVYGELHLFSNLPSDKRISLHSVDPSLPVRSIGLQLPCDFSKKSDKYLYLNKGNKLYKLFSEVELNESHFNKIFKSGYSLVKSIPWLAYPKYIKNPSSKSIPDVILDSDRSRVYYSNSLEWSSSCMEISVISARNVTNLIANKENAKIKKFFTPKKDDFLLSNLHLICKISSIFLIGSFLFSSFYKV